MTEVEIARIIRAIDELEALKRRVGAIESELRQQERGPSPANAPSLFEIGADYEWQKMLRTAEKYRRVQD